MTLIQCFSDSLWDNLAGCLRLRPDKLILLGDRTAMEEPSGQYRRIVRARGISVKVELRSVQGLEYDQIAEVLLGILRQEEDCVIDLTGSDERVTLAVGAVMALAQDRQVRVQRYDWEKMLDVDCDGDGQVIRGQNAWITVPELIALHGGTIHPNSSQPEKGTTPRELDCLWPIVAEAPKEWNRRISVLREFESKSERRNEIKLTLEELRNQIRNYDEKEVLVLELLARFRECGVIWDRSRPGHLHYGYTSQLLRYCTKKEGNLLEIKTLLEALAVKDGEDAFFQDGQMSVNIDWDGVINDADRWFPETRNEIDIVLMHGLTPLFISCKNGDIDDGELYKLHTMATRFGGPHARKMLVATDLDRGNWKADRSFIMRAADMNICLVTDCADLDQAQWADAFRNAMKETPAF